MSRRVALVLLGATAFATLVANARAASPSGAHLSWTRSASAVSCPDAGQVQADVVRRLGRNPFLEPSHVFIEAAISHEAGRWQAEIEMRDADGNSLGSREVQSDSPQCASLGSAAGLAIALMIEPDRALARSPTLPPAEPAPAESESAPVAVAPPAATSQRIALAASVVAAARVLPKPALGARLSGDLRVYDRLDVTLSLSFLPERRAVQSEQDVSFGLLWGALGPCYRLVDSQRVQLSACATVSFGALRSVVFEPARARSSQLPWAAAAAGLRVGVSPIAPLQLQGGLDVLTPLYRREYLVERAPGSYVEVFSDPTVAGAGFVGLGVQY